MPPREPDELTTVPSVPLMRRCLDCCADICPDGDATRCRSCSDTRRLLPRFLSLVRGRAHVRELLAEIDALDF